MRLDLLQERVENYFRWVWVAQRALDTGYGPHRLDGLAQVIPQRLDLRRVLDRPREEFEGLTDRTNLPGRHSLIHACALDLLPELAPDLRTFVP